MNEKKRPIFRWLVKMHDRAEIDMGTAWSVLERVGTAEARLVWEQSAWEEDAIFEVLTVWSAFGEE